MESPKRLATLLDAAQTEWKAELGDCLRIEEPEADATEEQLLRVHTEAHMEALDSAFARAKRWPTPIPIDADTAVSAKSEAAAKRAAGLVIAAVDSVFGDADAPQRAFVMARPPGHHATPNRPMGFCCYNNVLVGVAHAQAVHGLKRVAILDFDVHHGNGDADMTYEDPSRLYVSSHQSPCFPFTATTPGRDGPHGNVVSAPLPAGAGSAAFRGAWERALLPAVAAFEPDALFLSAGFDAHGQDPAAALALTDEDFQWITKEIASLARREELPIVSVLEGGYNVEVLRRCVKEHVIGLM